MSNFSTNIPVLSVGISKEKCDLFMRSNDANKQINGVIHSFLPFPVRKDLSQNNYEHSYRQGKIFRVGKFLEKDVADWREHGWRSLFATFGTEIR